MGKLIWSKEGRSLLRNNHKEGNHRTEPGEKRSFSGELLREAIKFARGEGRVDTLIE